MDFAFARIALLHNKSSYPRKRVSSTPRPFDSIIGVSGILGRPVKPGDDTWDERHCERSEAIHCHTNKEAELLRCFAPRNDVKI
jgi:hypothetical protein